MYVNDHETGTAAADDEDGNDKNDELKLRVRELLSPRGRRRNRTN